ncbi:pyridoxal 5'-phosphate synthase glutaminase subunit PdxT [Candidatus Bipolaricaulota bacterium]|nr:pyridoxal 5'-phosphate synthase glutaminase subunit PdxT [Candidatus Bipolaricaulota bacterium]
MIVGVLGLQGAVREHVASLSRLGIESRVVKTTDGLDGLDGLILPGGESTAISLLASDGFMSRLRTMASSGFPMFGTCAGMILLATGIEGRQSGHIGRIDITVSRNASGRQVDSFETFLDIEDIGNDVPAVFIRAPYITRYGPTVRPMASYKGQCVMAREASILVASFHPELTDDTRIHEYFVGMVRDNEI